MPQKDKKEHQESEVPQTPNGLETIRDILMGSQMENYSNTFSDLRKSIGENQEQANQELKKLESKVDEHFQKLEKNIFQKLDEMNSSMKEQVDELHKRIDQVSSNDKQKMAKLLAMMSQNLIND